MSRKPDDDHKVFARNRAASHNYYIVDHLEAGLVLTGSEVKSVRDGKVVIKDAFASIRNGEIFLLNMHISPYSHARVEAHEPERSRKLLLHRREIHKLQRKIRQEGLTLVPLRIYLGRGVIKCELGLAKGKKSHDKRAAKKEEVVRRETRDAIGRSRKGM
jgi:SsrA-binding protein